MDHVNLRDLVNISFVPPRHPRGTGFIGWDLVNSCDLAHSANSTLRSKHAHARFLLDWGGAQIGNKIEGNTESSNSAIQFSVFVFGIVRRIRRSRGRHLEHLRATLRARALVFQPSAGIEYSKLLFPILLHGIATLIFNLWSSYRSIDKKRCVTKRWQFRENSSHTQDMFILRCSSTCNQGALIFSSTEKQCGRKSDSRGHNTRSIEKDRGGDLPVDSQE